MKATEKEVAAAFQSWLEDYNRDSTGYEEEYGEPISYGEACAKCLQKWLTSNREEGE